MPRYVVIRETAPAPSPKKERVSGSGGNLELDYSLPMRHVTMSALFAGLGAPKFWAALLAGVVIFAAVPGDLRLRLLPVLLLLPAPFFLVPAFQAAQKEWTQFTNLVKQSRWAQEIAAGRDLDGDGYTGRPPIIINGAPQQPTREQLKKQQLDEFKAWIFGLDTGGTAFDPNGALGRKEYERRRDKLIAADLAEWKDPAVHTLGWQLKYTAAEIAAGIE